MESFELILPIIGLFAVIKWTRDRVADLQNWVSTKNQRRKCAQGQHLYVGDLSGTCECCGCPRWTPFRLGQRRCN